MTLILFIFRRAYGMWVHSVNLVLYLAYLSMLTLLATKDFTTSRGGSPANSTQNTTELPETKIYYVMFFYDEIQRHTILVNFLYAIY